MRELDGVLSFLVIPTAKHTSMLPKMVPVMMMVQVMMMMMLSRSGLGGSIWGVVGWWKRVVVLLGGCERLEVVVGRVGKIEFDGVKG